MGKPNKKLASVTTRDYTEVTDMTSSTIITDGEPLMASPLLRESVIGSLPNSVSVRTAKAHFSGLLEQVASGQEITITSDGVPKARLVPVDADAGWKPFTGTREHLKTMPPWRGGTTAEEMIRADRDERG